MDYQNLRAELTTDPTHLGYAAMTDAQAATAINAASITAWQDVPTAQVKAYLIGNNLWRSLQASSVTQAQQMVDTLTAFESIQLSSGEYLAWVQSALGTLVAAGVLTSAQQAAILAFGQITISRAQQIGLSAAPTAADILAARGN